ncbi:unnamed protein product [Pedinophyceae sp. YPF-701]|nr:unnamed protein product [Pedinophyceae sp. YPF-701]
MRTAEEQRARPRFLEKQRRTKPSLSLRDYLERILRYCQCSPASCVSAAVYIQRMAARDPHLVANSRTIHRLLLVGVIIATKFLDDRYFPNAYYAKVGGLTPAEVNELERDVLARLDFRVAVSAQDLQRCLAWLKHVHSAPPSSAGDPPALDVADSPASPAQPAAAAAAARLLSPDREFRGVRERVASYQDHMEGLWDGASSTARSSRLEGAARDSEAAEDGKCGTRAMTDESAGTPRLRSNEGAGSSGGVSEGGGEGCAQGRRRSHAEEATAVPPARATRDAASMPRTQG